MAAFAVLAGWAGWESSLRQPWLCESSFEEYSQGEELTNGTVVAGGYWTVPTGADTSAFHSDDRFGMVFSTSSTNGLVLNPVSMAASENDKAVVASLKMTGFEKLPEMDVRKDRAAIIIYAPTNGCLPSFQGWSVAGWQKLILPSGRVNPVVDAWYDFSIRLMADADGKTRVQYRIFTGLDYEPLQTEDGKFWLDIVGSNADVREMEVSGTGSLEYLKGSEMRDGLVFGVRQHK